MVVASLLCGFNIAGEPNDGTSGILTVRSGPCARQVVEVIPWPDQQFRVGDFILDAGMHSGDRLRMKYVPHADQTYVVPVQRNGAQTIVTSTLHWPQYRWLEELSATGLRLVMLVTGLIICPIASTWMTARS
jgi:hypothetical protein